MERTIRGMVNEAKGMLEGTRGLYKTYDAVGETIWASADSISEDFEINPTVAQIALEEMVYKTTYGGAELKQMVEDTDLEGIPAEGNAKQEMADAKRTDEMVDRMLEEHDMAEMGFQMVERVECFVEKLDGMFPSTAKTPEEEDAESEEFYDAMWEALARGNSKRVNRKLKLLEVLKDHIIKNATEVLADKNYWADRDADNPHSSDLFRDAVIRCQEGCGTDADWDLLVEETEM